jgi:hypothetical protein
MAVHFRWDDEDDWTSFSAATNPGEANFVWFNDPEAPSWPGNPFIGFHGRFTNNWSGGSGSTDVYGEAEFTAGRRAEYVLALRIESIDWSGAKPQTRDGPMMLRARNSVGGALGLRARLQITHESDGCWRIRLRDASNGSLSPESVDVCHLTDGWLIFRMVAESKGTVAPYRVRIFCQVIESRGGRERFLGRLEVPAPATDAYDFTAAAIGWIGLDKPDDQYTVHADWLHASATESIPLPPLRRGAAEPARLTVRVSRWDDDANQWVVVLDLDPRAIRSLQCSFLAHRIEEACQIVLQDRGALLADEIEDLRGRIEQDVGRSYRIDIRAPAYDTVAPASPTQYLDDPILWSGVLADRGFEVSRARGIVSLQAIGWTAELDRKPVTLQYWAAGTFRDTVVSGALNEANQNWPGTLTLLADDPNSSRYHETIPAIISVRSASVAQVLQSVAELGSYAFGISVSGYPVAADCFSEITFLPIEFRVGFFEARTELVPDHLPDATYTGRLRDYVWRTIDLDDPLVTLVSYEEADDEVATTWLIDGAPVQISVRSRPSVVPSGDTVREADFYDVPEYAGAQLQSFLDAHLTFVGILAADPVRYPVGAVLPVDPLLQPPFIVTEVVRNSGAYADIRLATSIPLLPTAFLTSLIFELDGGAMRSQTSLRDVAACASRGVRAQVISDPLVKGEYLAALRAHRELWAAARNARSAKVEIRGELGLPGHQYRNRVVLIDGTGRITRWGTTSAGGDAWGYLDDERPLGAGRVYEVRRATARYVEGSWAVLFELGSTARDLSARLVGSE